MANTPMSPPDGWNMTSGTWGSQAVAAMTGGIGSGGITMQSVGGTKATIVSDWISIEASGRTINYMATSVFNPSTAAAVCTINFVLYNASKTTNQATLNVWPNTSNTAGSYAGTGNCTASILVATNSLTPFGRWEITVTSTASVTFISNIFERVPARLTVMAPAQTITGNATTTWVPIAWGGGTNYVGQDIYLMSGQPTRVGVRKAGFYNVSSNVTLTNTAWTAGTIVQIRLVSFDTQGSTTTTVLAGPFQRRIGNLAESITLSFAAMAYLAAINDTVGDSIYNPVLQVQVAHNFAATAASVVAAGGTTLGVAL